MDDEAFVPVTGDVADDLARAWARYVQSGYDRRLWPEAPASEERQAAYDLYDRGELPPLPVEEQQYLGPDPDVDVVL